MHESLDRRHTELLIAIWEAGHLGHAAARLSISSSAASHRLREAERRLGVELTAAEGRSLRLTPAGIHLAEVAQVAHANLRSAEETARWLGSVERPTVRMALDFYDTAPWFAALVGVEDRSSDIDVVRVAYGDVAAAVQHRRADVGVEVMPAAGRGDSLDAGPPVPHGARHLADDELVGVVRHDHPAVARGALEADDITTAVYLTAGDRPQHGFEHHGFFEPAGARPHRLRKVESLELVLRLMRRYGGITVQPRIALADADLSDLRMVPLAGTSIEVRWFAILRPDSTEAHSEIVELIGRLITP